MPEKIKPLKKYGQNFLQNHYFAEQIVNALESQNDELLIEIGPGTGVLTELIIKENYTEFIALEIDGRFIANLTEKCGSKIKIIQQSILDFDFNELDRSFRRKVKIVGNIPYNITSQIIFKLLENRQYISRAVLMVQKEVANRLISKSHTKDYGILSVMVRCHAEVKRLFNVGRKNFFPAPKVDSSVIQFDLIDKPEGIKDFELFRNIVRTTFQTRRKILQNSLKRLFSLDILHSMTSIDLKKRPEELSLQEFKNLSNEIFTIQNNLMK